MKYSNLNGIILAAGRGSRLKNLTKNKPKSFLKVKKKYIIDFVVENFKKSGIKNVSIVTGYKSHLFKSLKNVKIIVNKKWRNTNIVGSLVSADKILLKRNSIISYADIFYEYNAITKLINSKNSKAQIFILNNKNWKTYWKKRFKDPLQDLETFKFNKSKILKGIGNKTDNYKNIMGQFMGVFAFKKEVWKKIRKIVFDNYEEIIKMDVTKFLNYLIKKHKIKVLAVDYEGLWFEIDNKKDYKIFKKSIEK